MMGTQSNRNFGMTQGELPSVEQLTKRKFSEWITNRLYVDRLTSWVSGLTGVTAQRLGQPTVEYSDAGHLIKFYAAGVRVSLLADNDIEVWRDKMLLCKFSFTTWDEMREFITTSVVNS
jgi:hypothetical protein